MHSVIAVTAGWRAEPHAAVLWRTNVLAPSCEVVGVEARTELHGRNLIQFSRQSEMTQEDETGNLSQGRCSQLTDPYP